MPNTTTVTGKVDIVDLIRDRKLFPLLEVPPCRVIVTFEVTTKALIGKATPAPEAKIKRMEAAARGVLEGYEKTITQECAKFSKKIAELMEQGKEKEAKDVVNTVNVLVKNALASAQGAAEKAIEDCRKKEAQGDKLLTEARIKTTVKVTFAGIGLATNITKLVASHGTDISSYVSIAKTLISLGLELQQQLKGEATLRADLKNGLEAYVQVRGTAFMEAARKAGLTDTSNFPGPPAVFKYIGEAVIKTGKNAVKGKDATAIAKDALDFTVKMISSQFKNVETARQMYRNHITKMRQKVDGVSVQADKLFQAMKKAPDLKEGVKIGAQCMQVKAKVTKMAQRLDECNGFLTAMETAMQGLGLKCDDRTILEKLRAIDTSTILSEGMSLVENIKSCYELFDTVRSAVGA